MKNLRKLSNEELELLKLFLSLLWGQEIFCLRAISPTAFLRTKNIYLKKKNCLALASNSNKTKAQKKLKLGKQKQS